MPLLNKEQILERGWTEEIFQSLTENKGQVVKSGENFWHLNSIEKMEKSEIFKNFNLATDNQTQVSQNAINKQPAKPVIKSTLMTKEQILERGWSEEAIEKFISGSVVNTKGQKLWQTANVLRNESQIDFIFFNNSKDFNELGKEGIELSQSLNIDFKKENCLLSSLDRYNPLKPIYHLTNPNFAPDENGCYTLFTDGTFKKIDKQAFASCGGWILDNNTNEVVFEFCKSVELDETQKKSMPKFELEGIAEAVKIINQLKLKNVTFYTDSFDEARRLYLAARNFKDDYYQENAHLYNPIIEGLKNSNSVISWLPREYNFHADELSEISFNAWEKQNLGEYKDKDYISEHGYKVDRDKVIYMHDSKTNFKDYKELENNLTLIVTHNKKGSKDYITTLIHDNINHTLEVLDSIPKSFSYIDDSLPLETKNAKKAKQEGIHLIHLAKALNKFKDLGNINICVSPLVTAIIDKVRPIPPNLQEEFFEFDKALKEYPGKITMTHKWKKLDEKMKRFFWEPENQNNEEAVIKKVKPR
jgi:ribonuclease HI